MADNQWLTEVVEDTIAFVEGRIYRQVDARHRNTIRDVVAITCIEGRRLDGHGLNNELKRREKERAQCPDCKG